MEQLTKFTELFWCECGWIDVVAECERVDAAHAADGAHAGRGVAELTMKWGGHTAAMAGDLWEDTGKVNTLRPTQNDCHFADDIFKCIFLNVLIWLKISLKFVPKIRINNIPALVQIMVWHRPGNKPLSEPMMVSLLTHIYVTRPQWVICHTEAGTKWP